MINEALQYTSFGSPEEALELTSSPMPVKPPASVRVAMSMAPVNPSDLIPITGAYSHRISLPMVAGYEGVGRVVEAPDQYRHLIGTRVLPLRGQGTWQRYVDCDPGLLISVPEPIDDLLAARAYINPFTAMRMLDRWPVKGKHILLTGAGSTIANLLALWAKAQGARRVTGIYRSPQRVPAMERAGVAPVALTDAPAITQAATKVDLVFDALGGSISLAILSAMRPEATLVSYGLLSGQPVYKPAQSKATYERYHLRDELAGLSPLQWKQQFERVWPLLQSAGLSPARQYPLRDWRSALRDYADPGSMKPILNFAG